MSSAVSGNHNHCKNIDYQVNQWIHFEIKQEKNSNGVVIYSIKCDGVTLHEVVNTEPKRFGEVFLYLSDPWYATFASFGELKNLKIVNLENRYATTPTTTTTTTIATTTTTGIKVN